MRSKEVEKAIKSCNLLLMGDITLHIIDDDGGTAYAGTVNKQYNDDLKTVLNYISELERTLKIKNGDLSWTEKTIDKHFIDKQVIRDKISLYELEIETLKTLYPKSYEKDDDYKLYVCKIKVLKELLEGE